MSPLQESLHLATGLTDNQVALLQGPALALPLVILAVPLGIAVDRLSRVRLLQFCAVLGIAGHLLTVIGHTLVNLFLARALVGLAAAVTIVAAVSLVADLVPPHARGKATMLLAVGPTRRFIRRLRARRRSTQCRGSCSRSLALLLKGSWSSPGS